MKPKIARRLRDLADKLDPPEQAIRASGSTRGGVVIETEGVNLWHPDQHGNVIEVEPDLIRQARRNGTLPDM